MASTMFDTAVYAQQALRSGATGYVTKQSSASELARAIREVAAGRRFVAPQALSKRLDELETAGPPRTVAPWDTLTDRERTVLRMVAEGESNARIAAHLGISVRTVESHRINMMHKMGFENQAALVKWACAAGLILP